MFYVKYLIEERRERKMKVSPQFNTVEEVAKFISDLCKEDKDIYFDRIRYAEDTRR